MRGGLHGRGGIATADISCGRNRRPVRTLCPCRYRGPDLAPSPPPSPGPPPRWHAPANRPPPGRDTGRHNRCGRRRTAGALRRAWSREPKSFFGFFSFGAFSRVMMVSTPGAFQAAAVSILYNLYLWRWCLRRGRRYATSLDGIIGGIPCASRRLEKSIHAIDRRLR